MAAPPSSFDGCLARSRAERTRPDDRRLKFYELRDILGFADGFGQRGRIDVTTNVTMLRSTHADRAAIASGGVELVWGADRDPIDDATRRAASRDSTPPV